MNHFHAFQHGEGDDAACAAGDGEEGDVEEGAFGRAHEEGGDRVGEETADDRGADEFSDDGCPEFMRVAVKVAGEESTHHRAGEGEKAAGAKEISNEGGAEGSGGAIARAAEDSEEDIDHMLQGKGFRHAQRKGEHGGKQYASGDHQPGKDPFAQGETFFIGRCHRKDLVSWKSWTVSGSLFPIA